MGSCTCIPNTFRCDGDPDCTGEQDELECGETELDIFQSCLETENYVRCPRSGKCIKKTWLCDGDDDCGDFSDETHCDGWFRQINSFRQKIWNLNDESWFSF